MSLTTDLLADLRKRRGFDVYEYIQKKIEAINNFFWQEGLDACVLGLSGGVDSAVTLGLLKVAQKCKGSPIIEVLPLILPIHGKGTTGQTAATRKAFQVAHHFKSKFKTIECSEAYQNIVDQAVGLTPWVQGQFASALRAPVLYFHAAILQNAGLKSIVCGTTNRDEGGYIGFYGKSSDMMVDLQPIADIHKSEVYKVARYLNIPEEIVNDKPRGDVWDGKTDEEMIGTSYDMVELFTLIRDFKVDLSPEQLHELKPHFEQIYRMNSINAHKYKVGQPCRFIDEMPRKVQGGWQ
jgi:NAD+ synthetase